ncbi:peptide chain release factor H [Chitinophaga polysaccharea]|uniref:peptide chain release factor H n=1 Tax=Chitinophaga TaxID=79328 RepID=UPI0014557BC3|nr:MULTISPECIES: peptide chain release factor H [Chitinophaga]NLR61409.1 peptide chain release factor H [Chitinophaga polysaccharea]NLU95245.1 peptide chain release factor H [Chitinophaga sp. Ak27]
MNKVIIQITSGRGPAECSRVVARVQELMLKQGRAAGISLEVLENIKGDLKGTLLSATLLAQGERLPAFIKEWEGTVQWVSLSPYRKFHKRKNWFAGVSVFDVQQQLSWNVKDVVLETCRASGPGGQHVNKVETAVRGTHLPSGLQVLAMDSRSQLQNKQLCLQRLEAKFLAWQTSRLVGQQQDRWQEHNELERGQAVKVIRERL